MKNGTMTEEGLERFLKWLDADRESAALKYEKLRRSLVAYFAKRRCATAEDLADNVLDAVTAHLLKQNSSLLSKPLPYIFGIARNVFRQYFNQQPPADGEINWDRLSPPDFPEDNSHKEQRSGCLHRCLQSLKEPDRQLFLLYYLQKTDAQDEYRLGLAARFGLTINGLRLKMMRLRDRLRLCITSCQKNAGA